MSWRLSSGPQLLANQDPDVVAALLQIFASDGINVIAPAEILSVHGRDRILGFTMIGSEAGEVMAVVEVAMLAGLSYTALHDAILTHPTLAEGLNSLFSSVEEASAQAASPGR